RQAACRPPPQTVCRASEVPVVGRNRPQMSWHIPCLRIWVRHSASQTKEDIVQYARALHENHNGARHRPGAGEPLPLLRPDAEPWLGRIATGLREVMRLQLLAALLHG